MGSPNERRIRFCVMIVISYAGLDLCSIRVRTFETTLLESILLHFVSRPALGLSYDARRSPMDVLAVGTCHQHISACQPHGEPLLLPAHSHTSCRIRALRSKTSNLAIGEPFVSEAGGWSSESRRFYIPVSIPVTAL